MPPIVYCVVERTDRITTPTKKMQLQAPLAYNNALAHAMRFNALDNAGGPLALTGAGVTAQMMLADGTTVYPITGTVSGSTAEVILPNACYLVPGRFKFTMNLASSGEDRTVLWVEGYVEKTTTAAIVDPGDPSSDPVSNIQTIINSATAAASAANAAAQSIPDLKGSIAPDYSDLAFPVPAGTVCWHLNSLYRAAEDIPVSETWTDAHWETAVASEVFPTKNIAPEYINSSEQWYMQGDVVTYEGQLYYHNSIIMSNGSFNPAHWIAVTVKDLIDMYEPPTATTAETLTYLGIT